ncbi:MAG: DNA-binding domain-containing protein [Pseudomonadota bacterium]
MRAEAMRRPAPEDIHPTIWAAFAWDYFSARAPYFAASYRQAAEMALAIGLPMLSQRAFRRRLDAWIAEGGQ